VTFWCDVWDFIKCYVNPNFEFTYRNVIFGMRKPQTGRNKAEDGLNDVKITS